MPRSVAYGLSVAVLFTCLAGQTCISPNPGGQADPSDNSLDSSDGVADGQDDGGNIDDNQDQGENDSGDTEVSDFTPASGAAVGPSGYGPWNNRLRVATSSDGMNWTRTGVTLADQADVPCCLVVDGTLWVFFVIWQDATGSPDLTNTTVAACSRDLVRWVYRKLEFAGLPQGYTPTPVDPTVVACNGGYRMYFTLGPQPARETEKPHTFSATSTDLIHWTYEGERYDRGNKEVLDPNLLWIDDHYEFFAGGTAEINHHATSADGLSFTVLADLMPLADSGFGVVMCNGMKVGGTYKYYGFLSVPAGSTTPVDIRSLTYDGGTWRVDDGARLSVDTSTGQESVYVKDPGVGVHPDGEACGYVMIYVTAIP
ncbi:MAG: hypothetical protein ACUVXJ_16730 [Phycisphaerae bacterium]